jgi:membrane protein implicated in regulation of membrane protease activity
MKEKLYNWIMPLGMKRGSVRAILALTSAGLFLIIILADIVALFIISNVLILTVFGVLTFMIMGMFALSQGWYFGERMHQSKEEPKKEVIGKPEVLSRDFILDEDQAREFRESQRG